MHTNTEVTTMRVGFDRYTVSPGVTSIGGCEEVTGKVMVTR